MEDEIEMYDDNVDPETANNDPMEMDAEFADEVGPVSLACLRKDPKKPLPLKKSSSAYIIFGREVSCILLSKIDTPNPFM